MKKVIVDNFLLKIIALALAIITWFYISGEMKRQAAGLNAYTADSK